MKYLIVLTFILIGIAHAQQQPHHGLLWVLDQEDMAQDEKLLINTEESLRGINNNAILPIEQNANLVSTATEEVTSFESGLIKVFNKAKNLSQKSIPIYLSSHGDTNVLCRKSGSNVAYKKIFETISRVVGNSPYRPAINLTIAACHSGSAIDILKKYSIKNVKLNIVTSSSSINPSSYMEGKSLLNIGNKEFAENLQNIKSSGALLDCANKCDIDNLYLKSIAIRSQGETTQAVLDRNSTKGAVFTDDYKVWSNYQLDEIKRIHPNEAVAIYESTKSFLRIDEKLIHYLVENPSPEHSASIKKLLEHIPDSDSFHRKFAIIQDPDILKNKVVFQNFEDFYGFYKSSGNNERKSKYVMNLLENKSLLNEIDFSKLIFSHEKGKMNLQLSTFLKDIERFSGIENRIAVETEILNNIGKHLRSIPSHRLASHSMEYSKSILYFIQEADFVLKKEEPVVIDIMFRGLSEQFPDNRMLSNNFKTIANDRLYLQKNIGPDFAFDLKNLSITCIKNNLNTLLLK